MVGPGQDFIGRDDDVMRVIGEEGLSYFTFDGLRRITGSHPETLSRTLDRLEDDGMLVRSPDGYALTGKGKSSTQLRQAADSGSRVPILHTFLPYGTSASELVGALKGRWFDRMRWVGMSDLGEGVVMKWVTDDGRAVIDARLLAGQLDVEARVKGDADLGDAVRAAHQLMGRISRLYSNGRPGRKLMMHLGYFAPYAM
ncbi:MAG TPA: hypothetical protein VEB67_02100 [Nitrososphaerales archaeon]|nr:hypothetical protein [Nitrososphaerales archaeon]